MFAKSHYNPQAPRHTYHRKRRKDKCRIYVYLHYANRSVAGTLQKATLCASVYACQPKRAWRKKYVNEYHPASSCL